MAQPGQVNGLAPAALTPIGEALYQQQTADRRGDERDFDLRRAWAKKGGGPFPPPPEHLPDMGGKLPNHPTFSVDSPYSTPQQPGGHWVQMPGNEAVAPWTFWPSQTNYDQGLGRDELQRYFDKREPNSLLMPKVSTLGSDMTPEEPGGLAGVWA